MRVHIAIAATVAGLLVLAAPASAHRASTAPAPKPAASTSSQEAPVKPDAPRICLFSVDGKSTTTAPAKPAPSKKDRAAKSDQPPPAKAQAAARVCDVGKPRAPTPHG